MLAVPWSCLAGCLDSFYENLSNDKIEFENKSDSPQKRKPSFIVLLEIPGSPCRFWMLPKITTSLTVSLIKGSLPELFHGMDFAYFIQDDRFCKAEPDFMEKAKPLSDLSRNGQFHFQMGRNTLSNFYHNVLPQLQDIADITEENPEKFRQYLTPKAHFVFYLDMEDDNITCKISSFTVKKSIPYARPFSDNSIRTEQQFRDFPLENSVLGQAMEWLPYYDADFDVLHCAGEEDLVYHMMESGTDALMELGEVRCTNRFRSKHTLKTVKVSVGVSLSGGLLDLNISTDDISSQELLDVLKSYQQKKKYYKLKSGEFVNLQEQNLEMLAELMKTLHLTPQRICQGEDAPSCIPYLISGSDAGEQ